MFPVSHPEWLSMPVRIRSWSYVVLDKYLLGEYSGFSISGIYYWDNTICGLGSPAGWLLEEYTRNSMFHPLICFSWYLLIHPFIAVGFTASSILCLHTIFPYCQSVVTSPFGNILVINIKLWMHYSSRLSVRRQMSWHCFVYSYFVVLSNGKYVRAWTFFFPDWERLYCGGSNLSA